MTDLAVRFGALLSTIQVPHLPPELQPLYAEVGRVLWAAMQMGGHTALSHGAVAAALDPELAQGLSSLRSSAAVKMTESSLGPVVTDYGYWYLQRYARIEARIASKLNGFNLSAPLFADADQGKSAASQLRRLSSLLNEQQYQAVQLGLQRQLLVLSGGPGTGKTYTISHLLALIHAISPDVTVAGCAPTGKAAGRLAQSCRHLTWAGTVHRLLTQPRGAADYLNFDIVVIDEATMLDALLADRLFAALAPTTRVVLAGDHQQLSSVLSGAVFAQCCELPEATCFLLQSQRFAAGSAIAALSAAINTGAVNPDPNFYESAQTHWIAPREADSHRWIEAAVSGFDVLLKAVSAAHDDSAKVNQQLLAGLAAFRVLCATHAGPTGVEQTNLAINRFVKAKMMAAAPTLVLRDAVWFPGRVVMATRNDPDYQLNNGDTGVCLYRKHGWVVLFESGVQVLASSLLHYTEGWAVTVHKAQGSEFDAVLIGIAPVNSPQSRRELIYTAVTRAKASVALYGDWSAVVQAAQTPTERFSGLAARLQALCRP
jgi:exodeoxyribonuclease V alpha subunit